MEEQIKYLKQNKASLEEGIKQIEDGISTSRQELENARNQINQAKIESFIREAGSDPGRGGLS